MMKRHSCSSSVLCKASSTPSSSLLSSTLQVMTDENLLGTIISFLNPEWVYDIMERDCNRISQYKLKKYGNSNKNNARLETIRMISRTFRRAFDRDAKKCIDSRTYLLYDSDESTRKLENIVSLELCADYNPYMDFLAIINEKSIQKVKIVEISGSIFEISRLSGMRWLMRWMSTRVKPVEIIWNSPHEQNGDLLDCGPEVNMLLQSIKWTSFRDITEASDIVNLVKRMTNLYELELCVCPSEPYVIVKNSGFIPQSMYGVQRLTIDASDCDDVDIGILNSMCNDSERLAIIAEYTLLYPGVILGNGMFHNMSQYMLLPDVHEIRFLGGPKKAYIGSMCMKNVTKIEFNLRGQKPTREDDEVYSKILSRCFSNCEEISINFGTSSVIGDDDGRTYLLKTLYVNSIAKRNLKIEVDYSTAEFMRLTPATNVCDYENPCTSKKYYIIGRTSDEAGKIVALCQAKKCCDRGSDGITLSVKGRAIEYHLACQDCSEFLDDDAKLCGDGVPECASSTIPSDLRVMDSSNISFYVETNKAHALICKITSTAANRLHRTKREHFENVRILLEQSRMMVVDDNYIYLDVGMEAFFTVAMEWFKSFNAKNSKNASDDRTKIVQHPANMAAVMLCYFTKAEEFVVLAKKIKESKNIPLISDKNSQKGRNAFSQWMTRCGIKARQVGGWHVNIDGIKYRGWGDTFPLKISLSSSAELKDSMRKFANEISDVSLCGVYWNVDGAETKVPDYVEYPRVETMEELVNRYIQHCPPLPPSVVVVDIQEPQVDAASALLMLSQGAHRDDDTFVEEDLEADPIPFDQILTFQQQPDETLAIQDGYVRFDLVAEVSANLGN